MVDFAGERARMVARQLAGRGIADARVLAAMGRVPREAFVPERERAHAYEDRPLPIGAGQTISQPYIVAVMAEALALKGGEKALEIGAGSGYAAAVLAELGGAVYAIERIPELAEAARRTLAAAGYRQVAVRCADGSEGWIEEAPFDAILVSAGAPEAPQALRRQLAIGGRMVIPVGRTLWDQLLVRITRDDAESFRQETLCGVRFVPLIGREAWGEEEARGL